MKRFEVRLEQAVTWLDRRPGLMAAVLLVSFLIALPFTPAFS